MRLTGIRLPGGDLVNAEVHHAFCFLRRYRGATAGFRPGGLGGGSMSLSQTQAAAARGDLQAAAALSTMTNRDGCMSGCASRGHPKDQWRQRLPPRPLPHRRRTALLRVKGRAALKTPCDRYFLH